MTFDTRDLTPLIGASIHTDAETLISGAKADAINSLLEQRGVLLFPKINLTDAQQVAFTKTLGVFAAEDGSDDGLFKVSLDVRENPSADYIRSGFYWHLDGTMDKLPIRASVLSARRLAPTGGQTEFANTYAAYEALSVEDKKLLEGLHAVHSLEAIYRSIFPEPSYAQVKQWHEHTLRTLPLVWTHQSGRKSLIVGNSASYVVGLAHEESYELLIRLRDFATQPQFVYRHEWSAGDMVMWDNTGTIHRAIHYARDSGRLMHRTKIKGEEAFA